MNNLYKLRSFGYVEINDDIWFSNYYFNAIIKVNKLSGQIDMIEKFPNYDIRQKRLYRMVCNVDSKLVFVPGTSEEVVSYDITSGEFISAKLDLKKIGDKKAYFWCAHVYGKYIYMFPRGAKCIIKYDVFKNSIEYLENSLCELTYSLPETMLWFGMQFEVIDKKIYIPFVGLNAIAIFNFENDELKIKYLNIKKGCSTINFIKGCFYLASSEYPAIYQWDIETDEIRVYNDFPDGFMNKGMGMFLAACHVGDQLIFFPLGSNMIISFDINTKKIEMKKDGYQFEKEVFGISYFVDQGNDKGGALTVDIDGLQSFFFKNGELKMEPYLYLDDSYNEKKINIFLRKYKYFEKNFENEFALREYMEILKNIDDIIDNKKNNDYGKTIFKYFNVSLK